MCEESFVARISVYSKENAHFVCVEKIWQQFDKHT